MVDPHFVPTTVSPEAAQGLAAVYRAARARPAFEKPVTVDDWDLKSAQASSVIGPLHRAVAERLGVTISTDSLGGVPVVRLRPASHAPDHRRLVYLHGGGYTLFSASTVLAVPALLANATGVEVLSVDYTLAPRGSWQSVTDEVLSVWRALLAAGSLATDCAVFGDSAGGGLAAGSVLKMRDSGLPLPAAVYLLSPWSDLSEGGDSYHTLAAADPGLNAEVLSWAAEAYAHGADPRNPLMSPVYGDYGQPFPPTLIQVGTREIFLSHAVRLYQAMRCAGREAELDVYEGMPHVHPSVIPDAPESTTAITRAAEFLLRRLPTARPLEV